MAEKTYPMTLAEKEKLEKELEELKLVRRPEVVERIKIARSYGDLSENSEYEAAKDEQAFVEGQISSLETKIRYAEIVDSDAVAKDEVGIGKTVTIQEVGETEKEVYIIVGSAGADAFAGKVLMLKSLRLKKLNNFKKNGQKLVFFVLNFHAKRV